MQLPIHERTKWVSFTAITALCAVLIAVIANHSAFPELLFHIIVMVLIGVIVILVAYAFLWQRSVSYIRSKMGKRRRNKLAREHFEDFRDFVERFTSLGEFKGKSSGITKILEALLKKAPAGRGVLIDKRIKNFNLIFQNSLTDFQRRLNQLQWNKKEINYEFLESLVREFENYVNLHKRLYVDFAVTMTREIGLDKMAQVIKRSYAEYKDDYNQFVIAYTEFAKRCSRIRFRIFNEKLPKANEL